MNTWQPIAEKTAPQTKQHVICRWKMGKFFQYELLLHWPDGKWTDQSEDEIAEDEMPDEYQILMLGDDVCLSDALMPAPWPEFSKHRHIAYWVNPDTKEGCYAIPLNVHDYTWARACVAACDGMPIDNLLNDYSRGWLPATLDRLYEAAVQQASILSAARDLVSIVKTHSKDTGSNFASAELKIMEDAIARAEIRHRTHH